MVGLEGGWGAGKTTVVNLLTDLLQRQSDLSVFRFDAWAHQGDPLRRTYLESLIEHFQVATNKWLPDARRSHWDDRLLEVSRRKKVTETHTEVRPSRFAQGAAVATVLMSIGLVFLSKGLETFVSLNSLLPINWELILGVTLSPALLWFAAIHWANAWRRGEKPSFRLLDEKSDETQKSATIETPDPTSLEFERLFNELMNDALSSDPNRSLVLVLDNLDRVEAKDFLAIWATLQTFLQHRGAREEKWHNQIRFLVPFDPVGLKRLWAESRAEDDGKHVATSFLDKSFQVRFEIPPLLLSNWKAYFIDLLRAALPEHSQEEREGIYHVLSQCLSGSAPTPRELILYVNQIGAIHRQWQGHQFPWEHITYYVYLRRRYENEQIYERLLKAAFPDARHSVLFSSGDELRRSLAGLFFNVSADLGTQLVLSEPILDALNVRDGLSLRGLARQHGSSFWDVLEQLALSLFQNSGAASLAITAVSLHGSRILDGADHREANTVRGKLGKAARNIDKWIPLSAELLEGISSICQVSADPTVSTEVIAALRHTLQEHNSVLPLPYLPIIEGLVAILDTAHGLGHQEAIASPFSIPIDAEGWIETCPKLATSNISRWITLIRPRISFEDICQSFIGVVNAGTISEGYLTALSVTQDSFGGTADWSPLVSAIEIRLSQVGETASPQPPEVDLLVRTLAAIRTYTPHGLASVVFRRLADGGQLLHWLYQAKQNDNVACQAICIAAFMEQKPDLAAPPSRVGESDAGHKALLAVLGSDDTDLAQQIVAFFRRSGDLIILFSVADLRKQYDPLIVACLREVAEGKNPETLYKPAVLLKHWEDMRANLPSFGDLIGSLTHQDDFVAQIQAAEFSKTNAGLYLEICRTVTSEPFLAWCRNGLASFDKAAWSWELANWHDALHLAIELRKRNEVMDLGTALQDALVDWARLLAARKLSLSEQQISELPSVMDSLAQNARAVLRIRLLGVAVDEGRKCSGVFFTAFGREMANPESIRKQADIVEKLFSRLVEDRNSFGLVWLRNLLREDPRMLEAFGQEVVEDFKSRIQNERAPAEVDEAHRIISEIADILGIQLQTQPPSESDAEASSEEKL